MSSDCEEDRNEHVWETLQRYYHHIDSEADLHFLHDIFGGDDGLEDAASFLDDKDDDDALFQPESDYQNTLAGCDPCVLNVGKNTYLSLNTQTTAIPTFSHVVA